MYTSDFVRAINEIYHDVEAQYYERWHPEIFVHEATRWQKHLKPLFSRREKSWSILDIGSGTGFVAKELIPFLNANDSFTCVDLSEEMLNICKKNIAGAKPLCQFRFLKTEGKNFPFDSESFDLISMNSLLHHIPDLNEFFKEIDRLF